MKRYFAKSSQKNQRIAKVHNWRPPCSCGVELEEVLKTEDSARIHLSKLHGIRPSRRRTGA